MLHYVRVIELVLTLWLIKSVFSIVQQWSRKRKALRLGCQPVRSAANSGLPGLIFPWKSYVARRNGRLPMQLVKSMDDVGVNANTITERFLVNRFLVTRDPENIKTVLSTKHAEWELGAVRKDTLSKAIGANIITHEGQAWKSSRTVIRPQFYLSQISDPDLFEHHVEQLCRKLEPDEEGWSSETDLNLLFHLLTLDIASEFLLGYSVNSQNPSTRRELPTVGKLAAPDIDSFTSNVDSMTEWMSTVGLLGKWQWLLPSRRFNHSKREVHKVYEWFTHQLLARKAGRVTEERAPVRYCMLEDMAKVTSNPKVLSAEIAALFGAARSTVAALLGWVFFYLSRCPDKYTKLRTAVNVAVGLNSQAPLREISKLRSCDYLQNCISEALRLGTPLPTSARRASQDTVLPSGGGEDGTAPVFVPKGTDIVLALFALHHRADIFGEDVEQFVPERWENHSTGWDKFAFGGGPRICIGRKFLLYLLNPSHQSQNSSP